jgi:aminopeptidase N
VLPTDVVPVHYDIAVRPDAAALTFTGSVTAEVQVVRATSAVTLNAADMTFGAVQLDGASVSPKVTYDTPGQTATLTFAAPLEVGKHRLAIAYAGKINQQAFGLFSVDYDTPQGSRRLLATQFESPDARRFAPMWDEPALKATFKLTVDAPSADMVVSNTPVEATEALEGGLTRTRFAVTPKMSSYLLFLAVGDFERVSRKVGDVDVGVVVKRGSTGQAGFALDAAEQLLPWFNDYFGTPYPLPKLDLVAVPGGAASFSAMENWGAILYFEKAVLVDDQVSSESDRQGAFGTIAHEMAHQWFGDLVTMSWWDDLWLNEGFASWMATKSTAVFHPEWSTDLQRMEGRDGAMNLDAREATHPVVQPVIDASDAPFDTISYQKGQAVINMVEAWVGEVAFRDALRAYMKKHAYGNTVSDDLWNAVEAASGQPIRQIAHDFTGQPGVPLIKVTSLGSAWRLAQRRFGVDAPSRKALTWSTPVAVSWPGAEGAWRGMVSMGQSVRIKPPSDSPDARRAARQRRPDRIFPHPLRRQGLQPASGRVRTPRPGRPAGPALRLLGVRPGGDRPGVAMARSGRQPARRRQSGGLDAGGRRAEPDRPAVRRRRRPDGLARPRPGAAGAGLEPHRLDPGRRRAGHGGAAAGQADRGARPVRRRRGHSRSQRALQPHRTCRPPPASRP